MDCTNVAYRLRHFTSASALPASSTMSAESSKRSNLIDVTYQHLHSNLSGHLESTTLEQLSDILKPRIEQLRNVAEPFGRPSDASKKKVDSGSVTLRDGVVLRVEEADKDFVFAISKKFDIDEVEALVLLRSFLYNEGLPARAGSDANASLVDELVDAITSFYHSERLFILHPIYKIANDVLPQILPDGTAFAQTLLTEYMRKSQAALPTNLRDDPKQVSLWVKQNAREQLVMLEVLFWTMWSYAPCSGPLVTRIYETAYDTHLGSTQENSTFLLDEESMQIQQDSAALWILLTIEVLELERAAEPAGIEVSTDPADKDIYWASPDALKRIHEVVISHGNSNFVCTYIAWTFVLSRLMKTASEMKEIPNAYSAFFGLLQPQLSRSYSKEREPVHVAMAKIALDTDVGLFKLLFTLLTTSPLFVTSVAWKTGSTVTDPNAVAYRFTGLIIAIVELVPVEMIPDFDSLVEVWVALFGRSESQSVAGICHQYWESDWAIGVARRAIFDVARSRFPVQVRPLIRLLRATTATGFLDTDPLSIGDHTQEGEEAQEERDWCARHVFHFFNELPTYTQVIHTSSCTGAHALYEKLPDRYGSSPGSPGLVYVNLRPIRLPGGAVLPPKSTGRLLSGDGGDNIVIAWQFQHSGWKVLLEILTDYVNRRRMHSGPGGTYQDVSFGNRGSRRTLALRLEDIGVEMDRAGDENVIMDALDLIRCVVQDNPEMAQKLLISLESGDPVVAYTTTESQPPDLVQLTTMILEEALSRSTGQHRIAPRTQHHYLRYERIICPPCIAELLQSRVAIYPVDSVFVWVGASSRRYFNRSRCRAHYGPLHYDPRTSTSCAAALQRGVFVSVDGSAAEPRLQQVKEEVLLRAARFVHSEIWVEHMGWKYAQLGDRFEIGRRVSFFYAEAFKHSSPALKDGPFAALSNAISDALLFKATTSTVNPLVASLVTGGSVLKMLYAARRYGDARRLIYLMESHLLLTRVLLQYKHKSAFSTKLCLLEQALCSRIGGGGSSFDGGPSKVDPVDALAAYVKERGMGAIVPVEAMQVLFALCLSLASSEGSASTIIGHLSDPEATVASLVRIVQHPYDDALLRNAVWNFITLAVDKEPALARLFVTGQFRMPSVKGKEKAGEVDSTSKTISAVTVACDMLERWNEYWEPNPQILASLLRFFDVIWQHGHEHKTALDAIRQSSDFFDQLAAIIAEELGPVPDCTTEGYVLFEGSFRSDHHEAISVHSYRGVVKSHALHIVATDIRMHLQPQGADQSQNKPASYRSVESIFKAEDQLMDLVLEAEAVAYNPELYDDFAQHMRSDFPTLSLDQLQAQEPIVEREYGDDFAFSTSLLQFRLQPYAIGEGMTRVEEMLRKLHSVNLNLSLTHVQTTLTESWQYLLLQVVPHLRGVASVRPTLLTLADSISSELANEKRSGEMMPAIHYARLSLLLALLEIAWFSGSDKGQELESFIRLVKNVRGIILNSSQSPANSVLGQSTPSFHRPLLQVIYFCARHCRSLVRRPKALNAQQRLVISSFLDATLVFVIDSLRITFDRARVKLDTDVDQDLELLVAVFEQCTRLDLNSSPTFWLTRCQETDVIRASLQLFSSMDIAGLSEVGLLRARKQALYAPHVLTFHMALARIPSAAERLASEGVLAAYSENAISRAIRAGMVDVVLPELTGERSPAHRAYCSMLAVVAGVITALGRHGHYLEAEASGLVQFYGDQIHRALSWTIGDPLSIPLLEEIEQVLNVFCAIAQGSSSTNPSDSVKRVLQFFTSDALLLLQQLNYALTHPNHLASLFEPITADEKAKFEADSSDASAKEVVDPMRRPFLARLVHRLFRLSGSILTALNNTSRADTVLIGEQEDWPIDQALIIPHSKVVLSEPASMGTLLELGNCSLDVLRLLVDRPSMQAITPASVSQKPLDVRDSVSTIQRNLEGVLVYAVTQLAMWLSKPEFDTPSNDVDVDDMLLESQSADPSKERRARKQSVTLAERLRRGMTGEMAADLQSLLNKTKAVMAKTAVVGDGGVDLTQVLSYFLQERVSVSP
ncbi:hypothetical protein A0H81_09556 [Grifola frondosa]|uniref:Uncharacterized protein n=1 Tax=Grifola frondosa TaxID=5627 RepID=A0A1C7LZZ9_GRIFR|nr:hypothetical protein A0H81_09556 [Grifola frondosa]